MYKRFFSNQNRTICVVAAKSTNQSVLSGGKATGLLKNEHRRGGEGCYTVALPMEPKSHQAVCFFSP